MQKEESIAIINGDFSRYAAMNLADIIKEEIHEADTREERKWQEIGNRYMQAKNDVYYNPRTVIGERGELVKTRNIADNRIGHAFLREMVEQKCNYLLGKEWSWKCKDEELKKCLESAFDDEFCRNIMNATRDAISMGIGWLYFYYDARGELKCRRVEAKEIYPIWADAEKKTLDAVIRRYYKEEYSARKKKLVEYVQYWDEECVRTYRESNGRYFETGGRKAHAVLVEGGEREPFSWNKVPFVAVKYNEEAEPLIKWTKDLIDEYDKVVSYQANAIEDQPNSIMVLKNYDGQKLDEFRKNLAAYRAVKVSDDGGVDVLQTPIGYEAASEHLRRIRQDIYAFGRGVDTRSERIFSAKSGVALKHEYAALDMDCNGLEIQIKRALKEALYFITQCDHCVTGIDFVFNRDIIINEGEAIDMFVKSEGLISKETCLANHPWVKNVDSEIESISKEHV